MANYTVNRSKHATLAANTGDKVTFSTPIASQEWQQRS